LALANEAVRLDRAGACAEAARLYDQAAAALRQLPAHEQRARAELYASRAIELRHAQLATHPARVAGRPALQQIYAHTFDDHHPSYPADTPADHQPKYFRHLARDRRPGAHTIVACVPCYDEEKFGLENTLNSLLQLDLLAGCTLGPRPPGAATRPSRSP
jgi:hypothetical protein